MSDHRRCLGPLSSPEPCGKAATLVCTDASGLQWFACDAHADDDGGVEACRGVVVRTELLALWLERNGLKGA